MNFLTFFRGVALAAALTATAAHGAQQRPPIRAFFQNATFSGAELSPNGRFVAFRVATKDSRATLGVLELETMRTVPVAAMEGADIGMFHWVNDQRIVFNVTDLRVAQAEVQMAPGLFAVDRDGSEFRALVDTRRSFLVRGDGARQLPWNTFFVGSIGAQTSDDVLVTLYEGYGKSVDPFLRLQRLNTRKGTLDTLDTPDYSTRWLSGPDGTPRVAVVSTGKRRAVQYRDQAGASWRTLAEFDALGADAFEPLWFGPDQSLYVRANAGKDKAAVYRYDLAANRLAAQPLVASPAFDVDANFIDTNSKLLGVRYHADGEITQWLDADMAAIQKTIDALLPETTNRIGVARRAETPYVLVDAFSDAQPHIYYIFNTATRKLALLGKENADIDPRQMGIKDMVRYKARDGLDIPAYLTLPAGSAKKDLPLVVLVHGGPYLRGGYWRWEREAQFLASRGYAVLEPEFRGSMGFGAKHFRAGWKQWGLAMQNDIADGARWAIAQGIADPRRICIAGASYGGYAAMMGLINDPDLFKCGINWVGVTDIGLMYSVGWSDTTDIQKAYGMPLLIGDPVKHADQFKATSPLALAARIKQPVLLAYGEADQRVPLVHGSKFHDALKASNPAVEWVAYESEGHGWAKLETKLDFWTRVEKFLDRNIGTAPPKSD